MNKSLLEEIVKHIFSNLMVLPSDFIDYTKSKSIKSKDFLLPTKIPFIGENDETFQNNIWGCKMSLLFEQEVNLILMDCAATKSISEYALLVQIKDLPLYGLYIVHGKDIESEASIAVSFDGNNWSECNTYLQATFLAGMEQIKEQNVAINKISDYTNNVQFLINYVNYHDSLYGE